MRLVFPDITYKEKAEEYSRCIASSEYTREDFVSGANYVIDAMIECLPKTHSFNPNEVIDIITSRIKELKK